MSVEHVQVQKVQTGTFEPGNFLGQSPRWYKQLMCLFLITNPLLLWFSGPQGGVIVGWLLLGEFIFTLAMALKCYPLQPGGLLALEAVVIGMASPEAIMQEMERNLPVILLYLVVAVAFLVRGPAVFRMLARRLQGRGSDQARRLAARLDGA